MNHKENHPLTFKDLKDKVKNCSLSLNDKTDIDWELLFQFLKLNKTITDLSLRNTDMGDDQLRKLSETLKEHTSIHNLNISMNEFSISPIEDLLKLLSTKGVKYLNLEGVNLKDNVAIAECIAKLPHLNTVYLSGTQIGCKFIKVLFNNMPGNSKLSRIDLSGNINIMPAINSVLNKLHISYNIKMLDISANIMPSEITYNITNFLLHKEHSLKELSIGNVTTARAKRRIWDIVGLLGVHQLKYLDISHNPIPKEYRVVLKHSLMYSSLTILQLCKCTLEDSGATLIADALKRNNTLKCLYLGNNEISENGAIALADMLQINTSLLLLDIWGNNIGQKGLLAFLKVLKLHHRLVSLCMHNSYIPTMCDLTSVYSCILDNHMILDLRMCMSDRSDANEARKIQIARIEEVQNRNREEFYKPNKNNLLTVARQCEYVRLALENSKYDVSTAEFMLASLCSGYTSSSNSHLKKLPEEVVKQSIFPYIGFEVHDTNSIICVRKEKASYMM